MPDSKEIKDQDVQIFIQVIFAWVHSQDIVTFYFLN